MYMIRSGQTAQTVPLRSLLVWAALAQPPQALCIEAGNIPGFDINDPNDVNNSAFAIEPADALETGVADTLGGQITVGL
jgi:hypothetical protein